MKKNQEEEEEISLRTFLKEPKPVSPEPFTPFGHWSGIIHLTQRKIRKEKNTFQCRPQ